MITLSRQKLRLAFHGMWSQPGACFNELFNYFTYLFADRFEVEIVDNYADVLIYSVYDNPPVNKTSKKFIYFPNENSGNLFDRAKAHNFHQFADATLTCNPKSSQDIYFPHFIIYVNWWENGHLFMPQGSSPAYLVDLFQISRNYSLESVEYKQLAITCFINNPAWPRKQILEHASRWIPVRSYGLFENNTYGPFGGDEYDKITEASFYSHHLAVENTITHGYCSEKLIHGFASGALPVYWGDSSEYIKYFNQELIVHITPSCLEQDRLADHLRQRTQEIISLRRRSLSDPDPLHIKNILLNLSPSKILDNILEVVGF